MLKKEYKISVNQDDWVTPEETLLDSESRYSDLERPISGIAFRIISFASVFAFLILGISIFKITVSNHNYFAGLALQNKSVNFSVPAPRGIIMDRNGQPLLSNLPSFDVLVVSKELQADLSENPDVKKVADILKINPDDFANRLKDQIKQNSIFFAAQDIAKDQMLAIKFLNPKGFYVITDAKRQYKNGIKFSQIVGYTGKINKDDLIGDNYYSSSDLIGKSGIEAEYENILRGEHGQIFFSQDEGNSQKDPQKGNNLVLNIDSDAQIKLYDTLNSVLRGAGLNRAAAIVQNPQNGQVLAMVSLPSFDNNIFSNSLSEDEYKKLSENKSKPLINRVISGLYNPGSTIKPFMALMILAERIFSPQDTIKDCISLTVPNPSNPDKPYIFKNWRADYGLFNLRRAIANSCNIYFFTAGGGFGKIAGLGIEKIAKYLKAGLADSILGIDLPGEQKGFVPTPDWKVKTKNEEWYQGDTYNTSIGQGDLTITPLWLNTYISAIANGGSIYQPEVAGRVVDDNNNTIEKFSPEVREKLPFSAEIIDEIKSDMQETVLTGTAHLLQDLPVSAGAKTGTAEIVNGKRINALFTAFAPFNNPEVSITVLVENSESNQGYAIVAANEFLKWYFGRQN